MKKLMLMCLFLSANLVYGQQLTDKIADETCECLIANQTKLRMDPQPEFLKCFFKAVKKYQKKIEKELGFDLNDKDNAVLVENFMSKVGMSLALNCDFFIEVMPGFIQQGTDNQHLQDSVYLSLGSQYYQNKEYELALEEYKKVPTNARNSNYYNIKGLCFYYLKDNFNAAVNYYRALESEPNSPVIYSNLAFCLAGLQKYDEALSALDSAIFYDPENADKYFRKGQVFSIQDKLDEADSMFRIAIAIDSSKAQYYSELAYSRYYHGDTIAAISFIEKAINLDEGDADYYYSLAEFLLSTKEYSMAVDNLEKYNQLSPESSEGNFKLIECYLAMGNTTMAKVYFQKMPATASDNYVYRYAYRKLELEIAQKDFDLGNYEAALRCANSSIENDSINGNYAFRAEIHLARGNHQAAINDYSKIIDKNPCSSCKYYKLRSESYTKLKMSKEAENDLHIWNLLGCEKRSEIDYGYDYEGLDDY
jgi:tetratricopeptide (TPR) repeat protein